MKAFISFVYEFVFTAVSPAFICISLDKITGFFSIMPKKTLTKAVKAEKLLLNVKTERNCYLKNETIWSKIVRFKRSTFF